jgi:hypothetical protein
VLPQTTISPSKTFSQLQNLGVIFPELQRRSDARVAKSKEFQELLPVIAKAKKERDNTVFPLKPEQSLPETLEKKKKEKGKEKGKKTDPKSGSELKAAPVIDKDDIQLLEAGHILTDAMGLLGKTDWTK